MSPQPSAPEPGSIAAKFMTKPAVASGQRNQAGQPKEAKKPPAARRAEAASTPQVAPPAPAALDHVQPGPAAQAPAPAIPAATRGDARPQQGSGATVRRTVFLDEDVKKAAREVCLAKRISNTQVTLLAINHCHKTMADLIAKSRLPLSGEDDLFVVVSTPPSPGKKQFAVSFTLAQSQTIDELVESSGASDRSEMINLALRTYLGL